MTSKPISLHSIEQFQEIKIADNASLVHLNEVHGSRILEILSDDPSIRDRVTVASKINSLDDVRKQINAYKKDEGLIRYVLLVDDNPAGLISFWRDDGFWGEKNLEDYGFGFFLDPQARGKGLIFRAVKKLIAVAIKHLQVKQFVAFCEDDNAPSIKVLKKLGFEPTDQTMTEPNKGWIERKYILNPKKALLIK